MERWNADREGKGISRFPQEEASGCGLFPRNSLERREIAPTWRRVQADLLWKDKRTQWSRDCIKRTFCTKHGCRDEKDRPTHGSEGCHTLWDPQFHQCVYAPQVGCTEDEKDLFWDSLAELMRDIPKDEDVYIGADLNDHVGEKCKHFSSVHGGHRLGTQNPEGESILQFAEAENLVVANTWFQKKDEHKVTYSSRGKKTQIDYILVRREKLKHLKNCKALPAESETTQHRLLVADVEQAPKRKKKWVAKKKRIKWWKLNSNDPDVKIEVEKFAEVRRRNCVA